MDVPTGSLNGSFAHVLSGGGIKGIGCHFMGVYYDAQERWEPPGTRIYLPAASLIHRAGSHPGPYSGYLTRYSLSAYLAEYSSEKPLPLAVML